MPIQCDFLVLGSGVAGLSFALAAAEWGEVIVLTKRGPSDTATAWAQGGIAAVLGSDDSFEGHARDTIEAGDGLCHRSVVDLVVRAAPAEIARLVEFGAKFSRGGDNGWDLGREGGHHVRRIVHAGDITGREVQRALLAAVQENPRIRLCGDHMAVDLIELSRFGGPRQVLGAYALDELHGTVEAYIARATILATGGTGKVYLYTSNPDVSTGDGMAMAYRAGAELANLEFMQFHPTCLFHPAAKNFLISEALRGEGGVLRLPDGRAFMGDHHPMKDLAPRDVVARAIDVEIKRTGQEFVLLDMSARTPDFLRDRFPNIHQTCLRFGIDLTCEPIPVVPAAHSMCGGVVTDEWGRTNLRGLWAIGEVACTGLHGANRLASNSLLEGLVFAHRAAQRLKESTHTPFPVADVPAWDTGEAVASDEAVVVTHNWDEIRRLMWNYVGIVRSEKRLLRAARRIALLQDEIREYYWRHLVTRDLLELRNIADVAEMIVACASFRRESRGLHNTLDYPARDDRFAADTFIGRGLPPHLRPAVG